MDIGGRRDGQHDFDFELGRWTTRLSRLVDPLSGSAEWVEHFGTSKVSAVWGGAANLVELDVGGPGGHIEALSLRLYNPQTQQWSLNFASRPGGAMTQPAVGQFTDGRGEFYGCESLAGRPIFVRFVVSDITADSCRFEQSFSADGGQTWELNWIAIDARVPGDSESDLVS